MPIDGFLVRAGLAALGLALAAAPLGCFVIWRRMAYFGDATAHAAILGVALALMFQVAIPLGVLLAALAMAATLYALEHGTREPGAILGVLAYSALALGIVLASTRAGPQVDLNAYLFGDILTARWSDILLIWVGAVLVVGIITWRWNGLLIATLNEDLAWSESVNPNRERAWLTLCLALTVAIGIKAVGAILIIAMLIIPAVTARAWARSPEQMVFAAAVLGVVAGGAGLFLSLQWDLPTGPAIIVAAAALFAATTLTKRS